MRLKLLVLLTVAIVSMAVLTYVNLQHIRGGTSGWSSSGGGASTTSPGAEPGRGGAAGT